MNRLLPNSKGKKILLAILFSLGIIFLVISEYDFTRTEEEVSTFQEDEYVQKLESRLSAIIEKMDGISDVSVMITLERGERYQYIEALGNTTDGEHAFRFDASANSGEDPILIATNSPIVKGVCVVCRGAKDAAMQNKIISLVASTLNLNQNQIYVTS